MKASPLELTWGLKGSESQWKPVLEVVGKRERARRRLRARARRASSAPPSERPIPTAACAARARRTSKAFPGSSGHEPAITMTGAREVCVSGCRNPLPDPENLPWSCRAARVLSPSLSFFANADDHHFSSLFLSLPPSLLSRRLLHDDERQGGRVDMRA